MNLFDFSYRQHRGERGGHSSANKILLCSKTLRRNCLSCNELTRSPSTVFVRRCTVCITKGSGIECRWSRVNGPMKLYIKWLPFPLVPTPTGFINDILSRHGIFERSFILLKTRLLVFISNRKGLTTHFSGEGVKEKGSGSWVINYNN